MMRVFVYEHLSAGGTAEASEELLAAGREMRDAVARDLLHSGDCAVSVATGPHATDATDVPQGATPIAAPLRAPGERAIGAAEFVAQQSRQHERTWVIAPETDGVLAQMQRAVDASRWLGCDGTAIALASSKRATIAHAAEHGVTTPLAFAASPATRRWVVKPDDGAGAVATRVHNTRAAALDDMAARRERGETVVLEAWVAGEPFSLSLLCSARGAEVLSVNRQHLAVDALGAVSFEGVQIHALQGTDARMGTLRTWAQALARSFPGLRGYVGIDLVWHAQRGPVLIEINPRATMAYVGLSATLGRNVAAAVLDAHDQELAHALA